MVGFWTHFWLTDLLHAGLFWRPKNGCKKILKQSRWSERLFSLPKLKVWGRTPRVWSSGPILIWICSHICQRWSEHFIFWSGFGRTGNSFYQLNGHISGTVRAKITIPSALDCWAQGRWSTPMEVGQRGRNTVGQSPVLRYFEFFTYFQLSDRSDFLHAKILSGGLLLSFKFVQKSRWPPWRHRKFYAHRQCHLYFYISSWIILMDCVPPKNLCTEQKNISGRLVVH